ncbi:MAG: LysR family transcriptional regulator [Pseudomonadota bacterium]
MKLADADLRLLRVFRTVADTGGFSQAAVQLNVGASTVSTHMANFEKRLGFRLCNRGRSGFSLTEKGLKVLELTVQLETALEDYSTSINEMQGKITGKLNIGLIDYMTSVPGFFIADVMDEFSKTAPDATLNLEVLPQADLIRSILDGRIHVGIGPNLARGTGLIIEPFLDEVMEIYCGDKHPLYGSKARKVSRDTIHTHRFVGNKIDGSATDTRRWTEPGDALGSNLESIAILILSGGYLGFLPTHFAEQWVSTGQMKSVCPDLISVPQNLNIVTRASGERSASLKEFLRILKDLCAR